MVLALLIPADVLLMLRYLYYSVPTFKDSLCEHRPFPTPILCARQAKNQR